MKKSLILTCIFLSLVFITISCKKDKNEIGAEKTFVEFTPVGGTVEISTKTKRFALSLGEGSSPDFNTRDYYISKTQDTLIEDWVRVVVLEDTREFEIKVDENKTGKDRQYIFDLRAGNYFESITIQQR